VDYLLRYTRDFPLAVIEAKPDYKLAADGLQQAKDYATMLGLPFAFATNGREIVEFDFLTGLERSRSDYPTPDDLWHRYRVAAGLSGPQADQLLTPFNHTVGKGERYYQQIAINRVVEAILTGRRRALVTMATGTGKTAVAFQIGWKLWTARWNRTGEYRRPRSPYPLPGRPQHPRRPSQGRHLRRVRRRAIQDRVGRGRQEPRDVLRHLSGSHRG
jgi:type I restriction enzyme, R subunit